MVKKREIWNIRRLEEDKGETRRYEEIGLRFTKSESESEEE